VFTYGIENEAQFMAQNINESLQGVTFDFNNTRRRTITVVNRHMLGRFNISNIMAAIIAVWSKGVRCK
jgi:UDP-N-acetylmuramoyl-L-alanyl-D-glutamate-L-lysine ligase